jgi:PadR family transcriptional regulator, regulatory protein PadR
VEGNLGEFELLVLLALVRLGDDAYGVSVQREIASRSGRDASFAAVYTTLSRLETKGFVDSFHGAPTPERGGRSKKHFTLTAAGRTTLQRNLRAIRSMTQGLDPQWSLS